MVMNKRIIAFAIYAIGLIGFPIWMIMQENSTFNEGHAYKFKCAPVDPNDPFRGKYIRLRFERIEIDRSSIEENEHPYYGKVETNEKGYAFISEVDSKPYIDAPSIALIEISSTNKVITFELPLDRLYMNENKAQTAEDLYRGALRDSTQNVYAKVYINGDRFLLDNVYIDDIPLSETIE